MGRRKPATPRRRAGVTYVNFATPMSPMASMIATATGMSAAAHPSRVTTSPALPVLGDSSRKSGDGALKNASVEPPQVPGPSFEFDLHKRVAIPGLDQIEPPNIDEQFVDAAPQRLLTVEKTKVSEPATAAEEEKVPVETSNALTQEEQDEGSVKAVDTSADDRKKSHAENRSSEDASSAVSNETEVAVSSPSPPSPLPPHRERSNQAPQQQQQQRQARGHRPQERMITISAVELERWQRRVVHHVEDHFSNEQLKRIAEFGRAHANLLVEAKEYVYNIETKLLEQFERDRAELHAQAEAYVAEVQAENRRLHQTIAELQTELEEARTREVEREEEDDDEASSSSGSSGSGDEVEIVEQHAQEPTAKSERSRGSKRTSDEENIPKLKKKDDRRVLKSRADRSSPSMIVDGYGASTR